MIPYMTVVVVMATLFFFIFLSIIPCFTDSSSRVLQRRLGSILHVASGFDFALPIEYVQQINEFIIISLFFLFVVLYKSMGRLGFPGLPFRIACGICFTSSTTSLR
ncbi:hypothetical protein L208DRAFT_147174 [Tricholoma matsutake]|nr:hypothetical protein L208DRAFT_147174 [Tricholoma matsutake 945]